MNLSNNRLRDEDVREYTGVAHLRTLSRRVFLQFIARSSVDDLTKFAFGFGQAKQVA